MESIEIRHKRLGYTIHNDPSMRLTKPHPPDSPTKPHRRLDDDLGRSNFTFGSNPRKAKPSRTRAHRIASDGSGDEIDSLTSSNADSEDEERRRITKISKLGQGGSQAASGSLQWHPDFPPRPRKLPSFRKRTDSPTEEQISSHPASSHSTTLSAYGLLSNLKGNENAEISKPRLVPGARSNRKPISSNISGPASARSTSATSASKAAPSHKLNSFPSLSPLRGTPDPPPFKGKGKGKAKDAPSRSHPQEPQLSSLDRSVIILSSGDEEDRLPSPQLLSHPHSSATIRRHSLELSNCSLEYDDNLSERDHLADYEGVDMEDTPRVGNRPPQTSSPIPEHIPSSSRAIDRTDLPTSPAARQRPSSVVKRDVADFPMLTPLSSLSSSQPDELPIATPPRPKPKSVTASFPFLSPLSSPITPSSSTLSRNVLRQSQSTTELSSDRNQKLQHAAVKPFPVSISPLKESYISSQDDIGLAAPDSPMIPDLGNESVSFSPPVDPSLLCPYCDMRLPPENERTPQLRKALVDAAKRSKPQSRPTNPLGRRADFAISEIVCIRHEFEMTQLPQARQSGWPEAIDWPAVRTRVERLQPRLASIVSGEPQARESSRFWKSVEQELKKSGSRTLAGIKGQFENFEKVQPGYYGEIGANIIYQTLYNLFPPLSFDAESISPLSPDMVLQCVLLPEAALALVMEDLGQDADTAARTLRDSARYGATMFAADDDASGGGDDVGHGMVRERARARALEIAAEERVEKRMLDEERRKRAAAENSGAEVDTRPKRYKETPPRELTDDDNRLPALKVKPKPRRKPASEKRTATTEPDSDASTKSVRSRKRAGAGAAAISASEDSDVSVRSTRSRTRAATSAAAAAGYAPASEDSDVIEVAAASRLRIKPKPRPIPRRTPASSDMDTGADDDGVLGTDMETPRPRRATATTRDPSVEIIERPGKLQWSKSMREEPISVTDSSDIEVKVGTRRGHRSKAPSRGARLEDRWLLASDD